MKNYITHLSAKNVGLFENLEISFNKGFNFIVGPNSSGKTSILKAIALSLTYGDFNTFRYGENSHVWIDTIYDNKKYRIGYGDGFLQKESQYRQAVIREFRHPFSNDDFECFCPNYLENHDINITPLILGAYRKITYHQIEGMKREASIIELRKFYRAKGLRNLIGADLPNVKQWMINRYYQKDKEWAKTYKSNWDWIISHLNTLAPANCSLEFNHIKRDLEPMFTLNGLDCYLEEISAGFQAVLSLVFAIVEWIECTNEENYSLVEDATGTVIVDELDVHLHPEWQLTIRDSLEAIFPNLQFIFTTHSPHLIATAKSGELIILPKLSRNLEVKPTLQTFSGWNTDEILEEVMQVKNLENKAYNSLLKQAIDYVDNRDIAGLSNAIEELKKVVHPSNTIIQVLSIKLEGLKLGVTDD